MLISIKISRNLYFLGSDKPRMLFFPLINVKIATIVGILTFMSRKILCSVELSMKTSLITLGPGLHEISIVWSYLLCLIAEIRFHHSSKSSPISEMKIFLTIHLPVVMFLLRKITSLLNGLFFSS